jgi:hypothetical protein
MLASAAVIAVGQSALGSACAIDPPIVPTCRIASCAIWPAALRITARAPPKRSSEAISLCVVMAPMRMPLLVRLMPRSA